MHYNQAGLPAPRAKHSQPHRSRVSVQPNDRSQTVTARSPLTSRARVEERTAVANRCRQIEHGSQGLVSLSVNMHVQDLLARMRSRHRKRGIHPCGNRERQQACETYDPQKSGPRPRAAPRKAAGRGNATISRLYVEPRTRRRRRHTPAIAASCPPRWQSGWHRRACRIRDPGSCVENPLAGPNVLKISPRMRAHGPSIGDPQTMRSNFLSGFVPIRLGTTRGYSSVLRSPQSR